MNAPALVSVIIPVYNGEQYISQAVQSLLDQHFKNIEIIIIDDGSTDDTRKILQSLSEKHHNIKIIEQTNQGVSVARNAGINVSNGDFIAFLDHDDVWYPDKIETQIDYLNHHPDVALVHSNVSYINETNQTIDGFSTWQTNAQGYCIRDLFLENKIVTSTVIIRKNVLLECGLFRKEFTSVEDYDLWLRIAIKNKIGHINKNLIHYRILENSQSSNWFNLDLKRVVLLNTFLHENPECEKTVGSHHIKTRMHGLYLEIADNYYISSQHRNAFEFYKKAILMNYFSLKCLSRLLICTIPNDIRASLKWHYKKILN